jgi:hypothetical protein
LETIPGACRDHEGCQVVHNLDLCPVCEMVSDLKCAHAETRGRLKWCEKEIDRLKKLERDTHKKLQSRIWELEDLLPEEDLEDDPPIEEPLRRDDMGARYGTEVTARPWGEGGGS